MAFAIIATGAVAIAFVVVSAGAVSITLSVGTT